MAAALSSCTADGEGLLSRAHRYHRARALTPEAAHVWSATVRGHLAPALRPGGRVLDLGSGTGRFAALLAESLGLRVVGVEPARAMRSVAARRSAHRRVAYVGGVAEHLPLRAGSVDAAWLSSVVPHVSDLAACARELRRVLRPDGRALVAGAFAGRLHGITLFRYFPRARDVAAEAFPSVGDAVDAFEPAGFTLVTLQRVTQQTCPDLRQLAERTRLRIDTTLEALSEGDYARGQAALERAARADDAPAPVVDSLDLLVFRAR